MLWIDVAPLLRYAGLSRRLSGIQRLECELYAALVSLANPRFLALHPQGEKIVSWEEVQALTQPLRGEGTPRAESRSGDRT